MPNNILVTRAEKKSEYWFLSLSNKYPLKNNSSTIGAAIAKLMNNKDIINKFLSEITNLKLFTYLTL